MKSFCSLIIFIFISLQVFAIEKPDKSDRILERQLLIMKATNDSLIRELSIQRLKEDQYIALFQSSISHTDSVFGWLLGIILGSVSLAGYITFRGFNKKIRKQKAYLKKYIEETDRSTQFLKYDLFGYESSALIAVAKIVGSIGSKPTGLRMSIHALEALYKAYIYIPSSVDQNEFEQSIKYFLTTINNLLVQIPIAVWNTHEKNLLRMTCDHHSSFEKKNILLSFQEHRDPEIRRLSLRIFNKLNDLLVDQDSPTK